MDSHPRRRDGGVGYLGLGCLLTRLRDVVVVVVVGTHHLMSCRHVMVGVSGRLHSGVYWVVEWVIVLDSWHMHLCLLAWGLSREVTVTVIDSCYWRWAPPRLKELFVYLWSLRNTVKPPCLLTNGFAGIDYNLKVFTVEYHWLLWSHLLQTNSGNSGCLHEV